MTIAAAVKRFLDGHGIVYHVSNHARTSTLEEAAHELGISRSNIARSVLLKDKQGIVMAVLPVTHRLDLKRLQSLLKRDVTLLSGKEADKLFADCEPGSRPPLGEAYGIACALDQSLAKCGDIYFEPGTHHAIVHVASRDFYDLLATASKGSFAYPCDKSAVLLEGKNKETVPQTSAVQKLQQSITELNETKSLKPLLPLFKMLGESEISITDIDLEQYLASSNISDALLMYHNHVLTRESPVDSVKALFESGADKHIIVAFLSSMLVFNALKIDCQGPLSAKRIWRHALFSATVSYWLQRKRTDDSVLHREAFIAALFQDIGLLLLGYLFEPEYRLMNRLALSPPGVSITTIERKVLGMGQAHRIVALGHERLGSWLLTQWNFNDEIIFVAQEHHNPLVEGTGKSLVKLVQLANLILGEHGFNESACCISQASLIHELQMQESVPSELSDKLMQVRFVLESTSQLL